MTPLLNLLLALALVGTAGVMLGYAIRAGRGAIAGIFGLPQPERPSRQDPDPAPRWVFPERGVRDRR